MARFFKGFPRLDYNALAEPTEPNHSEDVGTNEKKREKREDDGRRLAAKRQSLSRKDRAN
jgi:hypothetical protein